MDALAKEVITSDILIIGGGPAGLSAAIRAADLGVKNIVVADKGNPTRSGNAASGNDHFMCYIPEYHGHDTKPVLRELSRYPFFGTGTVPMLRPGWIAVTKW
jgi:succinate dehydrogenase/fumarate reductase flavoprotein subunit